MSYAVETKKRKFDRILEQLTEHSTPSRTSLNTGNNASTVSLVPEESDSAKKRRLTPNISSQPSITPSNSSLIMHYLPSDRAAFLERLETFRQVTKWHVPSTEPVNAADWAKRGWTCVDTDLVQCGSCREQLLVQLDPEETDASESLDTSGDDAEENKYEATAQLHDEVVKRFQSLIVTGHNESCSWRKRGCDSSIQRIEGLLNISNAILTLQDRYKSILGSTEEVPDVQSDHLSVTQQELARFRFEENNELSSRALALALCGWRGKGEEVVECRHCFRSLGLWLYRGNEPTMERLDPVDSHLEYCPWRSPEAQDTEVAVSVIAGDNTESKRKHVAGWELAFQAIAKDNAKKGRKGTPARGKTVEPVTNPVMEQVTPEQQEKKMKDLFKRLKETKKSFNVKGLLRRKEKVKT